jgi:hypothetical protein
VQQQLPFSTQQAIEQTSCELPARPTGADRDPNNTAIAAHSARNLVNLHCWSLIIVGHITSGVLIMLCLNAGVERLTGGGEPGALKATKELEKFSPQILFDRECISK